VETRKRGRGEEEKMGNWDQYHRHSGHDEVVSRNPDVPFIKLLNRDKKDNRDKSTPWGFVFL
jgi:hypothetical protein